MSSYAITVITDTFVNLCVFVHQVIPPIMFIFCTNSHRSQIQKDETSDRDTRSKIYYFSGRRFFTSQNNINRKKGDWSKDSSKAGVLNLKFLFFRMSTVAVL